MRVGKRNKEPTTGERWIDGWMDGWRTGRAPPPPLFVSAKVGKCVVEGWDRWMDGWNGLSYILFTQYKVAGLGNLCMWYGCYAM